MKPHSPPANGGAKADPPRSASDFQKRAGLVIATTIILAVLLAIHLLPSKVTLRVGEISPVDIRAHRRASYIDSAELERLRIQAAATVPRVYEPDRNAADQADGAIKAVFQTVETVRRLHGDLSVSKRVTQVRERLGPILGSNIPSATLAALVSMDERQLAEIRDTSIRLVSATMSGQVHDDEMRSARDSVIAQARGLVENRSAARIVGDIAASALRPNQVFNQRLTEAAQAKAREEAQAEPRVIEPGTLIIAKGETVFQKHIEKFRALGLTNPKVDYRSVACLTVLVIIAVLLVLGYLSRYHEDVYRDTRTLALLALIVILSVAALRVGGIMLGVRLSPAQVSYLGVLWVTAAAMLLAVLVDASVAVLIAAMLSVVLSLTVNNELRYAASALVTSLVGIYSVANIRDRNDLLRAVGAVAAAGVSMVWITGGLSGESLTRMLTGSVWAIAVAMAVTWLFWIGVALLERPFRRTTHVSLLELADTNKPLLRKLVMEAPGTYTHSMAVGDLAESAAEAIGADSLVARVASYYHDIGKIKRPHFFVENQHLDNVHDRMNPSLSALVITSHIKDGLETAGRYRLPKIVRDVISQHHGTSLVQYFFSQVAEEHETTSALEHQFRYAGPKPQTKEAGIVMLADAVEAASRCIVKPTRSKIELMVNRVVAEKLRDGQLDESDLTFRQISKVSEVFTKRLTATMHARIDYPEPAAVNGRKPGANGTPNSKQPKDAAGAQAAEGAGRKIAAG